MCVRACVVSAVGMSSILACRGSGKLPEEVTLELRSKKVEFVRGGGFGCTKQGEHLMQMSRGQNLLVCVGNYK